MSSRGTWRTLNAVDVGDAEMEQLGAQDMLKEGDSGAVRALEPNVPYYSRLSARSALYSDLRVLLDATWESLTPSGYRSLVIEDELKRIFDTFTHVSETLRRGGGARDVVGMWISGFFGSGKSHFAKVLGHLLQNDALADDSGDSCHDVFVGHLSDTPRGRDVRLRLGELKLGADVRTIAFEIKSRQSLNNPNSVGEILLSEFYRHIGLAENFVVARIEQRLQQRDLLDELANAYEAEFGVRWRSAEGRDDLLTVRRRLAEVLPQVDPAEYGDPQSAKNALHDMFRHEKITAEGIADELVAWVDQQPTTGARVQHLVFVIDEMGAFIGDSTERIGELNSLAEMIGNKGKGKVWLIVRLVLAACFRANAIYLERQTSTGPSPTWEYTGTTDVFAKVTVFKKTTFRVAETSLSVEQIRQASQALIAMGVTGTPESGNAIAEALRKLGVKLLSGVVSRRLIELIANHPALETHPNATVITQAREDMDAIVRDKAVVERWADYQKASDQACRAYREVYRRAYDTIREEVEEAVAALRGGEAYARAPGEQRDGVVDSVFGQGRVCHYPPVDVASAAELIEAAGRRSLTSLDQARVALPSYRARVEAELRELAAPPPDADEKVFEWRAGQDLTGRRFATEQEVDEAFAQETTKLQRSAEDLRARIREGFTVVVK